MPDETCRECLFAEKVAVEDYYACRARDALVMGFDAVCDFFEERGCICPECSCAKERTKTCTTCKYAAQFDSKEFLRCEVLRYEPVGINQPACKMYVEEPEMIVDMNDYMNDLADDYSNTTEKADECNYECRIDFEALKAITEPGYLREDAPDMLVMMLEDFEESSDEVFDTLAFLGDGAETRDVLSAILGMEATLSLIKRFLLDREE